MCAFFKVSGYSQADICGYLKELWVLTFKHETWQGYRTWSSK